MHKREHDRRLGVMHRLRPAHQFIGVLGSKAFGLRRLLKGVESGAKHYFNARNPRRAELLPSPEVKALFRSSGEGRSFDKD